MSGHRPREDTLATAIDRLEDLRDAVQAQTQAIHVLADCIQDIGARLDRVEKALSPEGSDDSKLEDLLARLVDIGQAHSAELRAIQTMLLELPKKVAGEIAG